MFYSKSAGGFFSKDLHQGLVPQDAVEITRKQHAELLAGQSEGKAISADANGKPVLTDPPPAQAVVPSEITMRQCRLALHRESLLASVQPAIDALEEPLRGEAQIEWDYATSVRRDSEVVFILAKGLEIEDSRLDDLFLAASKL